MDNNGFRLYSAPAEEVPVDDFELAVDGQPVFTHAARVSAHPKNHFCRDYQRPLDQTELASFASWDMAGPVEVRIRSRREIETVKIRPLSKDIKPLVKGNEIHFTINKPGQYTVEVNGSHRALHLFADPCETDPVDLGVCDPQDIYFGPGVHCPGLIRLNSGQRLYIAGGAVVYGAVVAEKATDIVIRGRGILDGSKISREDGPGSLLFLYDCSNVRVEGITLRDSFAWTMVSVACRDVEIRNFKIIGNWRFNSDGIDFVNCRSCLVEDSFVRAFDDCLVVKGYESWGNFVHRLRLSGEPMDRRFLVDGMECSFAELQRRLGTCSCPSDFSGNITWKRCVIWCDWGRPLEIGAETAVDVIENISYEECDLIHNNCGCLMSIHNQDRAQVRNINYRDIRVELDEPPLQPYIVKCKDEPYRQGEHGFLPKLIFMANDLGYVSVDDERGSIKDIRFENIDITAPHMPESDLKGFDGEHAVECVSIRNLRLNGSRIMTAEQARLKMNEFTRDIAIR
jgi:hypothetical protein